MKKLYFLISITFITAFSNIHAQNLKQLESEYRVIQDTLRFEKVVFDSLNTIFNARVQEIDLEKKKAEPDEKKIVTLLAQSASLSNQLESQQQKMQQISLKIEEYEGQLYKLYADILDSLQTVEVSQEHGGKENIDNLILYYTEKKVSVSPQPNSLSFDPRKIIQFGRELNVQSDSMDHAIYQQYLQNALSEVESQLYKVDTIITEIEKMRQLQNKASKFMDEMAMENEIRPYVVISEGSNNNESIRNQYFDERIAFTDGGKNLVLSQAESYAVLLRQLSWNQARDANSRWQSPVDSLKLNISIEEYLDLLQQLAKGLSEYRIVLRQKISRLN